MRVISFSSRSAFRAMSLASNTRRSAVGRSLSEAALILTLRQAPRTAARMARAPTPASEALAGLPVKAIARQMPKPRNAVFMVSRGTCVAKSVARWIASERRRFSSSLPRGIPKALIRPLKASVSLSTRTSSSAMIFCPWSAHSLNSRQCSSQPRLWLERLATMVPSAAPRAPI